MASNIPVPASESPRSDMARVVYNLSNLAGVGGGRVLVVGFGNAMKGVVKACAHAQIGDIWVTGTEDKLRGFSCSGSAQVAVIAAQFDKRLFANEYAVIKACESCKADALLIADPESPLAQSALLVQEAAKLGAIVLAALPHSKDYEHWLLCEPTQDTVSDPVWRQCPKCRVTSNVRDIRSDGGVCPECGSLYRLGSEERIRLVFDAESFTEWDADVEERDPLDFPGFDQMIKRARMKSGCTEGVRCGLAELDGIPVAVAVMEASFMMGSMGYVVGEKIARTVERATKMGLPLIIFTCSGGARMQEGLVSLMQMAKVSAAIERHGAAGLPYFSVICDPTTGGVTASFAMQGDVILSEPHALIGFAGRRVIQDTIKQTLPESFQTAEFCLEHGLIDAIVERTELRGVLANLVKIHVVDAC
ncbi:MAG: acetyl-CoA carboxylase, carboxyltransferase subunit beta, partial [Eggerthellaceae bacterium]